jgi:hypothetical protein
VKELHISDVNGFNPPIKQIYDNIEGLEEIILT